MQPVDYEIQEMLESYLNRPVDELTLLSIKEMLERYHRQRNNLATNLTVTAEGSTVLIRPNDLFTALVLLGHDPYSFFFNQNVATRYDHQTDERTTISFFPPHSVHIKHEKLGAV